MIGWSVARMRRYLVFANRRLGGTLLLNVGRGSERPRWAVTLEALQSVAPQWFIDPATIQREVERLNSELDEVRGAAVYLDRRVREESRRVDMQTDRIIALARARS